MIRRQRSWKTITTGVAILLLCFAPSATPQTNDAAAAHAIAVAESASVARAAFARARAAMAADSLDLARRELLRATYAWPAQPSYWWSLAQVAANAADTALVLEALGTYARFGLGRNLEAVPAFRSYVSLPAFRSIVETHHSNQLPMPHSTTRFMLPDSAFWPEGIAYNPATEATYVTSVRHRTIAEIDKTGHVRELLPRDMPGIGAILGVAVAESGKELWATSSGIPQMAGYTAADSAIAEILLVDIATGRISQRWPVPPASRPRVLGDVQVGRDGRIYVTDSGNPDLLVLDPKRNVIQTITNPLFRSLQGIAITPDAAVIYVADYSHGILRVDVPGRVVLRVADAPGSTSLGCDGIAWKTNAILCIQNGVAPARVMKFQLDTAGSAVTASEILDRNYIADEPTAGVVAGCDFIYVANSQWEKYDDSGALKKGAVLRRPILLAVRTGACRNSFSFVHTGKPG